MTNGCDLGRLHGNGGVIVASSEAATVLSHPLRKKPEILHIQILYTCIMNKKDKEDLLQQIQSVFALVNTPDLNIPNVFPWKQISYLPEKKKQQQ